MNLGGKLEVIWSAVNKVCHLIFLRVNVVSLRILLFKM